tara:strand:- start:524 stop:853 length:330 start_codon:yes stop_codon:yes gene_type:complete
MEGYVYLLLQIDTDGLEKHKIGITKNDPQLRVKQLATGNPNKISLLRKYKTINYLKVEKWLHRKHFATKTEAKNEWRILPDEFVFSFLDDCKEADDTIKFLIENNSLFE